MFNAFEKIFRPEEGNAVVNELPTVPWADDCLGWLYQKYGGRTFNQGIYRILAAKDTTHWNNLVFSAFPNFSGRITCFSMDWLGRIFAIDSSRLEGGRPGIVMFEPGTGEALEIPCNVETFHESELIQYREEALAESFYHQWLASGGSPPEITQCIGYKRPLFLGGSDTVDNLEMSDLDVYWTITAQLIQKTRGVAPDALIGKVTII